MARVVRRQAEIICSSSIPRRQATNRLRASVISPNARAIPWESQVCRDYLDLMAVHSIVLPVSMKPLPLQEFWPLQAFAAVLQALLPLQALAPVQTTLADAAVAKVLTANTVAAVAIMMRFDILFPP